ncbi:SpoIIE family protein phosphatase [Streptomyces sp. M19]
MIGDVQGKGLPAIGAGHAVLTSFREAAQHLPDLDTVVTQMEAALIRHNAYADTAGTGPGRFVTALVLQIGPDGRTQVVGCGHTRTTRSTAARSASGNCATRAAPGPRGAGRRAAPAPVRARAGRPGRLPAAVHRRDHRGTRRDRRVLPAGGAAAVLRLPALLPAARPPPRGPARVHRRRAARRRDAAGGAPCRTGARRPRRTTGQG